MPRGVLESPFLGWSKSNLEKTVSKMTPALKLSLLWEECLTRSPPQGLTSQIFLRFHEILYLYIYTYTHIKVMENVLPNGLLLAQPFKVLNTQVKWDWEVSFRCRKKIEVASHRKCFEVAARCHMFGS